MHCEVLKPFLYAHDGISVARLERGVTVDIDDVIAASLQAEGFVRGVVSLSGAVTPGPASTAADRPMRRRGRHA